MPITVSGTSITFNDATTQTTAGITSAVTSLNGQTGAITNTNYGAIGSYAGASTAVANNTSFSANSTIAGSSLRQRALPNASNDNSLGAFDAFQPGAAQNPGFTGTWRAMSNTKNQGPGYSDLCGVNLWVRIS